MKKKLYRVTGNSKQILRRKLLASCQSKEQTPPDLSKNTYQVSILYHSKECLLEQVDKQLHKPIIANSKKKICMLFTGQGSQYPAMGKTLYERLPLVKKYINNYAQILKNHNEINYLPCLIEDNDLVNQTMYTQPAIVMLQLALDHLWKELGIHGEIFIGHSVGEFAAASSVGYFEEEDILKLIAKRASLMQSLKTSGGMIAVRATKASIQEILKTHHIELDYAAFNAPEQIVLSGEVRDIATMHRQCKENKIKSRILAVSHPFHSRLMQPMTKEFYGFSQTIKPKSSQPKGTIISNLTAKPQQKPQDSKYWSQHILNPVNFEASIRYSSSIGAKTFIEVGPDAILSKLAKKCIGHDTTSMYLSTMVKSLCPVDSILQCAATLDNNGHCLNWKPLLHLIDEGEMISS